MEIGKKLREFYVELDETDVPQPFDGEDCDVEAPGVEAPAPERLPVPEPAVV